MKLQTHDPSGNSTWVPHYYGTEICIKGSKDKGDTDLRKDFPGGWPDDSRNTFKANGRTDTENKYFNFTKQLLIGENQSQ